MSSEDLYFFLNQKYFNNTIEAYLKSLVFLIAIWLFLFLFKRIVLRQISNLAKRSRTQVDDFILAQVNRITPIVYLSISLYIATRFLSLPPTLDLWLLYIMIAAVTFRIVRIVEASMRFGLEHAMTTAGEDRRAELKSLRTFSWLIHGLLWLIAGLFLLSNLGINITSIVAGLGIGGIAVALAAQSILGDFFSSLTILLDKPFRVGDFIVMDTISGTVEEIGIKNSRIRSISGELVVMPNSHLTSNRIHNFRQMAERRIQFRLGIRYQTPLDVIRKIPEMIREVISANQNVRVDRVHIASFAESSIQIEGVYYVKTSDYSVYMDAQQEINLKILETFAANGIEFAFPTRTILIEGPEPENNKPVKQ